MKTQIAAVAKLIRDFWLNLRCGGMRYAMQDAKQALWLAIWRRYRCVSAWEVHRPKTRHSRRPPKSLAEDVEDDDLAQEIRALETALQEQPDIPDVIEIDPNDTDDLAYVVRVHLRPGNKNKVYIRFSDGIRLRVRLTRF